MNSKLLEQIVKIVCVWILTSLSYWVTWKLIILKWLGVTDPTNALALLIILFITSTSFESGYQQAKERNK